MQVGFHIARIGGGDAVLSRGQLVAEGGTQVKQDAINDQRSKAENGEGVKDVHIILAECPKLSELQAAIKGEPQEAPEYAYTGCEVFINHEIYTMLEQCDKLIHADTVTH